MDLYMDKENVISFINSQANDMYMDCVKLMKKQLDVKFNFKKDELKKNPGLMLWYTSNFTQGVEDSEINFDTSFPEKPLKSNSAIHFNSTQLSSVYLLDDSSVTKFKESGSVIVGNVGEEVDILQRLFFRQDDYLFDKKWLFNSKNNHPYIIKSWTCLREDTLPLTDIIIADSFVLKMKDGDEFTVDENLIKFLEVLVSDSKWKVNVIIFTKPGNIDYEFELIEEKIKNIIQKITGKKGSFTLVKTSKEHDRNVITNYKLINAGDTLNFWNKAGIRISNGKGITYSSYGNRHNHTAALSMISDFQEIISFNEKNNTDYIQGDKKSNFLNFN